MLKRILILSLIFLAGFASHDIYRYFYEGPVALQHPYPRIQESQVELQNDKVVLHVSDPQFAAFTPTHSMDPILDSDSHAIEIKPQTENEIHIGDIVSYDYGGDTLIHRVIDIKKDEKGTYFVMKGDNNPEPDPVKVRFNQVERVLVAILY